MESLQRGGNLGNKYRGPGKKKSCPGTNKRNEQQNAQGFAEVRKQKFMVTPICILCQEHQSRTDGRGDPSWPGDRSGSLGFRLSPHTCCLWHKQFPFYFLLSLSSQQDGQGKDSPISKALLSSIPKSRTCPLAKV